MSAKTPASRSATSEPVVSGLLQRRCECGQHTVAGGQCSSCRRSAASAAVRDVLREPGEPLDPTLRALLEPRFAALRTGWLDEARALGCVAVIFNHALVDAALLATVRGAGMRACVYTVNDPAEARRLDALGIDGIVTDAVDRFAPAAAVAD